MSSGTLALTFMALSFALTAVRSTDARLRRDAIPPANRPLDPDQSSQNPLPARSCEWMTERGLRGPRELERRLSRPRAAGGAPVASQPSHHMSAAPGFQQALQI